MVTAEGAALSPHAAPLTQSLLERARQIGPVPADCDGVLTDGSVYYSAHGEEMKRFSIRDGMGVERLRRPAGVESGGSIIPAHIEKPT